MFPVTIRFLLENPSAKRLMADSTVGTKYIDDATSATLRLISSGIVMSNDLSPASTWPTAMWSLEATSAPARTALVSP